MMEGKRAIPVMPVARDVERVADHTANVAEVSSTW